MCFLFFHRLSAGSFIYLNDGSRNFGNLNMNGECIVMLYFLCFGYDCILLFDCRDTRRYARVFIKNLLVSSFLFFLLCFLFVSLDIKEMIEFLFVTHKTAQLFANIAGDHRTLCHHCQTLTNCLPA